MILSHGGQSELRMDTVTNLSATQSLQKSSLTSQDVFIYVHTSVRNNWTVDLSTMGPTLSIFIH